MRSGRFRLVLREDLKRAPVLFSKGLCSRTRTSRRPSYSGSHSWAWRMPQNMMSGKDSSGKLRVMSFTREPGVPGTPGARGGEATAIIRSSSPRPGAKSLPGAGGEGPTAGERWPSLRGPGAVRIPGAGGDERVIPTVSTSGPPLPGPGAVRIPGAGVPGTTLSPGGRWSVPGSDVVPVNAIGLMGSSNAPPLGSQLWRKVPG